MTAEAAQNALRRKTSGTQAAVGPTAMDATKAIRVAMSRAGDVSLDCAVGVREVSVDSVMPEGLSEAPVENALLVQLTDGNGALGLAVVCPQSLGAVIEASTLGQVFPTEAEPRTPTPTDAMLVNGFLNTFIEGFASLAKEISLPPPVEGYRCADSFEDLRAAQMALADAAHKRYKAKVDFGLGAKVGQLEIVVPAQRPQSTEQTVAPDIWASSLEKAVMATQAELEARLCRFSATLEQIATLNVGDMIPLPDASLDGVDLMGLNGKRAAGARLGRAGIMRAVRVRLVDDEAQAIGLDNLAVGDGLDAPMMALPDAGLPELGAPALELDHAPMGDLQMGDLPMDNALEAAPLDLDLGQGDDILGAIEPAQIPIDEVNFS